MGISTNAYNFTVGDRVYYNDNGPTDTGTVTKIVSATGYALTTNNGVFNEDEIVVEFDDGVKNGEYWASQLTLVL